MAEPSEAAVPLGNVNDSVAVSLLDDLKRSKKISEEEYVHYRSLYEAMFRSVAEAREKESFLRKAVRLASNARGGLLATLVS